MSQAEIDALLAQEQELSQKLKELKKEIALKQKSEADRIAMTMPFVVKVTGLQASNSQVRCVAKYRSDIVDTWKSTPGHVWSGYEYGSSKEGINLIPLAAWEACREKLESLPHVTIEYAPNVEEQLHYLLHAAPWEIEVESDLKHFLCTMGPGQNISLLSPIAGAQTDFYKHTVRVPLSEGWRIPTALDAVEGVIYSDEARAIIVGLIEQRERLDKIAKQKDSSDERLNILTREVYDPNDQTWKSFRDWLKPFQRVGVHFGLETDLRFILADDTGLGKTAQLIALCEIQRLLYKPNFMAIFSVKASNIPGWRREIKRLSGLDPVICYNKNQIDETNLKILVQHPNYILISHETLGAYDLLDEHGNKVKKKGNTKGKSDQELTEHYIWSDVFKAAEPDFFGIDEAHQIKNPSANRTKAARSLVGIPGIVPATASPIKNRTTEFFVPLNMVNPTMFSSFDQFERTYTIDGKFPKNVDQLQDLIRPFFLRRKKNDVIKDLPPINRIQRFTELSDKAKDKLVDVEHGMYQVLEHFDPYGVGGETKETFAFIAQLTRYQQIVAADTADFTVENAIDFVEQADDEDTQVLLFSRWKGIAAFIANKLEEQGHKVTCTVKKREVNGELKFVSADKDERDELFEEARRDKSIKYVVTTLAAKEGHNLEFCMATFFNEIFWSPEDHAQCEGRAFGRLANPHAIDSFYTMAETKIVEFLWQLVEGKIEIIEATTEGVEPSRDQSLSIVRELMKKLKEHGFSRIGS